MATLDKAAKSRKYYSMLEKLPSGRFKSIWTIQFGDYDRKVVTQEVADQKASGSFEKGTQFKIICTDHTETAIQDAVKKLNGGKDFASSLDVATAHSWGEKHVVISGRPAKLISNVKERQRSHGQFAEIGSKIASTIRKGDHIYLKQHEDGEHVHLVHAIGYNPALTGNNVKELHPQEGLNRDKPSYNTAIHHIVSKKTAKRIIERCEKLDKASIESSLDVAGAEEHEKYKDHTKNPYYKVLTAHGFKHVSTEHKQNRFATNNPKHDYTEHLYKHPKHGKSHVVITQEHTKMRSDPQNHWLHRHEQSNGIMAPCHGNTKPQLDRDLTENYGGKSDKAAFERTDKHTKHVYALDKGTIVKSHNLPHNKTWLKKHPEDAERKLVTAQHAVSHVKRGDRLYVGKYDDANTWLLHLGSKDRAGFKCKHLLTNTSVKKLLAKCNKLENN